MADADSPDPLARKALAAKIRDACIRVGFFYIKNHSIPTSLPEAAIEHSLPFFALPEEEKMKYDIHASSNFKGYNAFLSENTDPEGRGDLNEGFNFGWETLEDEDGKVTENAWNHTDGPMSGMNVWPNGGEDMKVFRRALLTYYHSAVKLGLRLFPLLALALDLPENFFDDKVFTILYQQDEIPALQVLNSAGKWIQATPIHGTLVVNLGDQLARWTNDVFKSTVHRAINRSGVRRYSIPLFFGTDYDVPIDALPSCVSDTHPAKYEPITAGEYVKSRLEATYTRSKAT
ncbi:hypothetical protein FRC19_003514 [Serendipita sp. 401]|nr:hypothetical protein FRC19_003514 [Serendipita sp. 401]